MKKLIFTAVCASALFFAGCASNNGKALYNWGDYSAQTYQYIKSGDEDSMEGVLKSYQWIIDNQTGTVRETVPPGVCADYGYLLARAGRVDEGKAFLQKEKELYPESAQFVDSIIRKIDRR